MKFRVKNKNRAQRHRRQMAETRQRRADITKRGGGFEEIKNQAIEKALWMFPQTPVLQMDAAVLDTAKEFRFHATESSKAAEGQDTSKLIRYFEDNRSTSTLASGKPDTDNSSAKALSSTHSSTTTMTISDAAASISDRQQNRPSEKNQKQIKYAMVVEPKKSVFKPWTWNSKATLVPISEYDVSDLTSLQRAIVICDRLVLRRQPKYRKNCIEYGKICVPRIVQLQPDSSSLEPTKDEDSSWADDSLVANEEGSVNGESLNVIPESLVRVDCDLADCIPDKVYNFYFDESKEPFVGLPEKFTQFYPQLVGVPIRITEFVPPLARQSPRPENSESESNVTSNEASEEHSKKDRRRSHHKQADLCSAEGVMRSSPDTTKMLRVLNRALKTNVNLKQESALGSKAIIEQILKFKVDGMSSRATIFDRLKPITATMKRGWATFCCYMSTTNLLACEYVELMTTFSRMPQLFASEQPPKSVDATGAAIWSAAANGIDIAVMDSEGREIGTSNSESFARDASNAYLQMPLVARAATVAKIMAISEEAVSKTQSGLAQLGIDSKDSDVLAPKIAHHLAIQSVERTLSHRIQGGLRRILGKSDLQSIQLSPGDAAKVDGLLQDNPTPLFGLNGVQANVETRKDGSRKLTLKLPRIEVVEGMDDQLVDDETTTSDQNLLSAQQIDTFFRNNKALMIEALLSVGVGGERIVAFLEKLNEVTLACG